MTISVKMDSPAQCLQTVTQVTTVRIVVIDTFKADFDVSNISFKKRCDVATLGRLDDVVSQRRGKNCMCWL
jgi:hypothetical protein